MLRPGRYPYNAYDPWSDRAHVAAVHPFDPFEDTVLAPSNVRGIQARAYWAEYSEQLGSGRRRSEGERRKRKQRAEGRRMALNCDDH